MGTSTATAMDEDLESITDELKKLLGELDSKGPVEGLAKLEKNKAFKKREREKEDFKIREREKRREVEDAKELAPASPEQETTAAEERDDSGDYEPDRDVQAVLIPEEVPQINFSALKLAGAPEALANTAKTFKLVMSTRTMILHQGADKGTLEFLFEVLSFSSVESASVSALEQLKSYYQNCQNAAWLPSVGDIYNMLCTVGYDGSLITAQGAGSSTPAKGSTMKRQKLAGSSANKKAVVPSDSQEAAAKGCLPSAGKPGVQDGRRRLRVHNVQCLIRLLSTLCRLQIEGCIGNNFLSAQREAGKNLILALVRLQLDPVAAPYLLRDAKPALALLSDAWGTEPVHWGHIVSDVGAQLATVGSTHRGSLEAISALPSAESAKAQQLQQVAAVQLVKKMLMVEASGSGASRSRGGPAEIKELLRGGAVDKITELIYSFAGGGRSCEASGSKQVVDWWRLMTAMEASNIVLWQLAVSSQKTEDENELLDWWVTYVDVVVNTISGTKDENELLAWWATYNEAVANTICGTEDEKELLAWWATYVKAVANTISGTEDENKLLAWWATYVEAVANTICGGANNASSRAKAMLLDIHNDIALLM
eukprot:gene7829-1028_t